MSPDRKFSITSKPVQGVFEIIPRLFTDDRGFVFESFNIREFTEFGIPYTFLQDAESFSHKGVLRGLHFQKPPHAHAKLVHVSHGSVLDVVVDLRTSSPTFRQWCSVLLRGDERNLLWVPTGCAHGILVLEEGTCFHYKFTDYFTASAEGGVRWDDPTLEIDWQLQKWGIGHPVISEKDSKLPLFRDTYHFDE